MKLEYLEEFLFLAQIGNYSAAAESLFLSESTLISFISLSDGSESAPCPSGIFFRYS